MNPGEPFSEEKALEELGLSKNEARVYLCLLELGSSAAGKIAKFSRVHRANVYDSINKLKDKGLISEFIKKDSKYFIASDPQCLVNLIKEKELSLSRLLPKLNLLQQLRGKEPVTVSVSYGLVAVKNSMLRHLIWKKPIYTIGSSAQAFTTAMPFVKQFHKQRIAKRIPMNHLYNSDSSARAREVKRMKYTTARVLPGGHNSAFSINICGDEITMKFWAKDAIVITINSKDIAQAYEDYHRMLWKISSDV